MIIEVATPRIFVYALSRKILKPQKFLKIQHFSFDFDNAPKSSDLHFFLIGSLVQ